jgi:protein-L-isoaspartate O-methyltransferase
MLTEVQREKLTEAMNRTFFAEQDASFKNSEAFQRTLSDHVDGRQLHFSDCVVPWLRRHVDIGSHHLVEIGSGTGSSTAAVAPHVDHVTTFEISESAVLAAKERAIICGYKNVSHRRSLFDAEQALRLRPYDGVFLAAVLEHCSFKECIDLLRASWLGLKPGGWMCVIDTPNRFCPIDHHTSFLPFFSTLPITTHCLCHQIAARRVCKAICQTECR